MTDLVERLRTTWEDSEEIAGWQRGNLPEYEARETEDHILTMHKALHEAADEIERLRELLKDIRAEGHLTGGIVMRLNRELKEGS